MTSAHTPTIADRKTFDAAASLMQSLGDSAGLEAAQRAEASRDRGNLHQFCHWRQVARTITLLSLDRPDGTVH